MRPSRVRGILALLAGAGCSDSGVLTGSTALPSATGSVSVPGTWIFPGDDMQAKVDSLSDLRDIIASYISNDVVPLGLFFSPVFSSFLEVFLFDKVVYDCVNDAFNSTDQSFEMIERENHLIAESDLVLTNEEMIYDSKYLDHPNVHCIKKSDQPLAVAMIDRMTERMEVLISSSRNYGVRI